jgi:hypothetical protein
MLIELA